MRIPSGTRHSTCAEILQTRFVESQRMAFIDRGLGPARASARMEAQCSQTGLGAYERFNLYLKNRDSASWQRQVSYCVGRTPSKFGEGRIPGSDWYHYSSTFSPSAQCRSSSTRPANAAKHNRPEIPIPPSACSPVQSYPSAYSRPPRSPISSCLSDAR